VKYSDHPEGPGSYFGKLSNFTNLFSSALFIAQTVIGDAFLVCIPRYLAELDFDIVV